MKKHTGYCLLLIAATILFTAGCKKDDATPATGMSANIYGFFGQSSRQWDPCVWNAGTASAIYSNSNRLLIISGAATSTFDSSVAGSMQLTISNFALSTVTASIDSPLHPAGESFTYKSVVNTGTLGQVNVTALSASGIQGTFSFAYAYPDSTPGSVNGSFNVPLTITP